MVCFTIRVIYPLQHSISTNRQNDRYLNHLVKHYSGAILYDCVSGKKREWWYEVAICNNDAADFLDSLPAPFYLDFIDYTYGFRRLYTNQRISTELQAFPRTPYENHIYWKAVYTEHNMTYKVPQAKIEKRWIF